jgi:hypothetical protein
LVLSAITSRVALSIPVLVTHQSIADLDLGGRRSGNAKYFILDDSRFADAHLRVHGSGHQRN